MEFLCWTAFLISSPVRFVQVVLGPFLHGTLHTFWKLMHLIQFGKTHLDYFIGRRWGSTDF